MAVYIVITMMSLLLAPMCALNLRVKGNWVIRGKSVYLFLMAVACTLCMGLRSEAVGTDTALYAWIFEKIGKHPSLMAAFARESNTMPAYILLCRALYRISPNPQFHIFAEAVIINIGLFVLIRETSVEYPFSTFLYFGLTLMYFGMNGARQTMSVVICANAIVMLARNIKSVKGWIWFAVGCGTHVIGLISAGMIAGIILYNIKLNKKFATLVFAGAGAAVGVLMMVMSGLIQRFFPHYQIYFNSRAAYSMSGSEGGGRIVIIYLYLALFLGLWLVGKAHREYPEKDELFSRLVPGMTFGMFLGIFNAKTVLISRMVWYYSVFFIPFLPYSIARSARWMRWILKLGTIAAFLAYSLLFLRENQGEIVPYQLFWM